MIMRLISRWRLPFLEAGLPVFVDKPLSLDISELCAFKPYLETGQLMSCSGMRYARELDEPRADLAAYGRLKLIRGAIVSSWEKYGVHLLEAILAMTPARPVSVRMLPAEHASAVVRLDDGVLIQIDALGECARTFHVEIFGTQRNGAFDITDNFSMFRRMLWEFAESIRTGRPAIPAEQTLEIMRVLDRGPHGPQQKTGKCFSMKSHYKNLFELNGKTAIVTGAVGILGQRFCRGSLNSAHKWPWWIWIRSDAPPLPRSWSATMAHQRLESRAMLPIPPRLRTWWIRSLHALALSTSSTTTPHPSPPTWMRFSPARKSIRCLSGGKSCPSMLMACFSSLRRWAGRCKSREPAAA